MPSFPQSLYHRLQQCVRFDSFRRMEGSKVWAGNHYCQNINPINFIQFTDRFRPTATSILVQFYNPWIIFVDFSALASVLLRRYSSSDLSSLHKFVHHLTVRCVKYDISGNYNFIIVYHVHSPVSLCDKFLHSRFCLFCSCFSTRTKAQAHTIGMSRMCTNNDGICRWNDTRRYHIYLWIRNMWSCRGEQVWKYSRNYYFNFCSTTMVMRRKNEMKRES